MSFTFSELKQAIQDFSENDETTFVNNLTVFIKNAEEKILKNVQLSLFRKNSLGSFTAANKYLTCPTDFLAPLSMSFTHSNNQKIFLEYKDVDFVQTFAPNSATTGTPKYYALFDVDAFIIGPTPDTSSVVELNYFYRPDSLTSKTDSGTTWLSENAPMTILYGSLVEAYTFMKGEPDVLQNYQQQFMQGLQGLKMFGEAKEVTDQYRTGMVIRPKQ
jgi:hypothetical protein